MKKVLSILAVFGLLNLNAIKVMAQDNTDTTTEVVIDSLTSDSAMTDSAMIDSADAVEEVAPVVTEEVEEVKEASFHQVLKEKFIEGGAGFMGVVLIALILGLALCIERIIYLNLATTDTDKLLADIDEALKGKKRYGRSKRSLPKHTWSCRIYFLSRLRALLRRLGDG